MFFNFNLQELADWSSSFDAAAFEKELSSIAGIATVAAVNSPAVVDAPKGTAPSTAAVQTVVNQVVEAVAPVVAPRINPVILSKLENIAAAEVVANPQIKASDAGATVSSSVVNNIASSISSSFKSDAQQDRDLNAAIKEAAQQPGTTATTTAKPDAVNLPFDTTKPVTSQTMPFDTTKPVTTTPMTSTTVTTPTTTAAAVQTGGTFTGEGYQNAYKKDPLLLDGKSGIRLDENYKWWNTGIDYARERGAEYVAVLNDDVQILSNPLRRIAEVMKATGATLGYPFPFIGHVCGYCWVLDLKSSIRLDENYKWWYGDRDLDLQARKLKGVVHVPAMVRHIHGNELTRDNQELVELTKADEKYFLEKWKV